MMMQRNRKEFMTFDEIVNDVLRTSSPDDLKGLAETKEEDLITYHMSLGLLIRNKYKLWDKRNNTFTGHPDDYSFKIIKEMKSRIALSKNE